LDHLTIPVYRPNLFILVDFVSLNIEKALRKHLNTRTTYYHFICDEHSPGFCTSFRQTPTRSSVFDYGAIFGQLAYGYRRDRVVYAFAIGWVPLWITLKTLDLVSKNGIELERKSLLSRIWYSPYIDPERTMLFHLLIFGFLAFELLLIFRGC
jgi:hypothetical protein